MNKIRKVLALDDEDASHYILKRMLNEMSVCDHFESCKTVTQAISTIKASGPDNLPELIFLDIELHGESGFDFLKQYEELGSALTNDFSPTIVMLSSHMTKGKNRDISKQYELFGVVDQLRKPVDQEDIRDILDEHF